MIYIAGFIIIVFFLSLYEIKRRVENIELKVGEMFRKFKNEEFEKERDENIQRIMSSRGKNIKNNKNK